MNTSFSSVAKPLLAAMAFFMLTAGSAQAGGLMSGAELRAQLTAFLAEQGLAAAPAS